MLCNLMPQLEKTYLGEELNISGYPNLHHIIQTGHGHLAGINRFKDVAVYTGPNSSPYRIPENDPSANCITVLKNGQTHVSYTGSQLVDYAKNSAKADSEVSFINTCLQRPYGFGTVLSSAHHF